MSSSNSLALEALSQNMPAVLHVVEAPDMEAPLDPFEHKVLLLPGDVDLADRDEKRERNVARLEVCRVLRAEYGSRLEVTESLARYELPEGKRRGVREDSKLYKQEVDASKYRMLEKREVYPLFMAMERGIEAFVKLGYSTENAQEEDVQAFIDHVAVHSILFHTNQRLALNTARQRYGTKFGNSPYFQDIALDAMDALNRSLQLFNYYKGLTLSTFVVTAIRTQTDRYITNHLRAIRMPTNVDYEHKRVVKVTRELGLKLGRDPTLAEVAKVTNYTEVELAKLHQEGRYDLTSLDIVVSDEGQDATLGQMVADPLATNAHQKYVEDKELAETLQRAIDEAGLRPEEMIVLSLRHGVHIAAIEEAAPKVPINKLLDDADKLKDGLSYRTIAQALKLGEVVEGITGLKVKAMEEEALDKLSKFKGLRALSNS